MENIFLTGVTGVVGSQLFYELLKLRNDNQISGKILLLVRPTKALSADERIKQLLDDSLIPDYLTTVDIKKQLSELVIINSNVRDIANIKKQIPSSIKSFKILHLASLVNLSSSENTFNEILANNHNATIDLLEGLMSYCERFCFISTAFSSGHRSGIIDNDFLKIGKYQFRNPYEKFKMETELGVKELCEKEKIDYQILRPSVVCGRLLDKPYYTISKYLVFYLLGAFFFRMSKSKYAEEKLHIQINPNSGLNIVPVDYVAKVIIAAMNNPIRQLNIVSSTNISTVKVVDTALNRTGIKNWEYVQEMPATLREKSK